MRRCFVVVLSIAGVVGCGGEDKPSNASTKVADTNTSKTDSPKVAAQPPDLPPGPGSQTHVNGLARFKDPGVYADGKLVGMLKWGELPPLLPVYWYEEEATTEEKAGEKHEPVMVKQRRYRFEDYFTAIGLDTKKIKAVHIYSASKKRRSAWTATGDEVRKEHGFAFRFGNDVFGKPIPACPNGIGRGKCPDSLGQVVVYLEREAPRYEDGYFYFGKERVDDVPYYGVALRGGVRVYLDGRYVAVIKRKFLRGKGVSKQRADGVTEYSLWGFLEKSDVPVDSIVEAWLVENDRYTKKLTRDELMNASFIAKPGQSGEVFLGKDETKVNALQLSSKPLSKDQLPKAMEWELDNYE